MAIPSRMAPEQLRALARLSTVPELRGFYLAGGTAVAVHLGHRTSRDLDLFSTDDSIELEATQRALIHALPDIEVLALGDATLQVRLEGVPVDIVRYRYAPLESTPPGPEGFPTAGALDLAVMKLAAIARRGLYRDFWDLHALMIDGGISLESSLEAYKRRFGKTEPDLYHVVRALTYFDDAERAALMPSGLTPEHWQAIRTRFETEAPAALERLTSRTRL